MIDWVDGGEADVVVRDGFANFSIAKLSSL